MLKIHKRQRQIVIFSPIFIYMSIHLENVCPVPVNCPYESNMMEVSDEIYAGVKLLLEAVRVNIETDYFFAFRQDIVSSLPVSDKVKFQELPGPHKKYVIDWHSKIVIMDLEMPVYQKTKTRNECAICASFKSNMYECPWCQFECCQACLLNTFIHCNTARCPGEDCEHSLDLSDLLAQQVLDKESRARVGEKLLAETFDLHRARFVNEAKKFFSLYCAKTPSDENLNLEALLNNRAWLEENESVLRDKRLSANPRLAILTALIGTFGTSILGVDPFIDVEFAGVPIFTARGCRLDADYSGIRRIIGPFDLQILTGKLLAPVGRPKTFSKRFVNELARFEGYVDIAQRILDSKILDSLDFRDTSPDEEFQHLVSIETPAPEKKLDMETENLLGQMKLNGLDCRACPVCSVPILKDGGCKQMWCANCGAKFNMQTGALITGHFHNPEYTLFLEKNEHHKASPKTFTGWLDQRFIEFYAHPLDPAFPGFGASKEKILYHVYYHERAIIARSCFNGMIATYRGVILRPENTVAMQLEIFEEFIREVNAKSHLFTFRTGSIGLMEILACLKNLEAETELPSKCRFDYDSYKQEVNRRFFQKRNPAQVPIPAQK